MEMASWGKNHTFPSKTTQCGHITRYLFQRMTTCGPLKGLRTANLFKYCEVSQISIKISLCLSLSLNKHKHDNDSYWETCFPPTSFSNNRFIFSSTLSIL